MKQCVSDGIRHRLRNGKPNSQLEYRNNYLKVGSCHQNTLFFLNIKGKGKNFCYKEGPTDSSSNGAWVTNIDFPSCFNTFLLKVAILLSHIVCIWLLLPGKLYFFFLTQNELQRLLLLVMTPINLTTSKKLSKLKKTVTLLRYVREVRSQGKQLTPQVEKQESWIQTLTWVETTKQKAMEPVLG